MIGVVMAGGVGSRMRASGMSTPKVLTPVGGVPLLIRSVCSLLRHGLSDVVVCTSAVVPEVVGAAHHDARPLVEVAGGRLEVLVEHTPRGNIGAVSALAGRGEPALVVYADNLTTLDLAAVAARHADRRAAMTLATHDERFHIPYGRITAEGDRVTAYDEKPTLSVEVASAVTVLSAEALALVPADRAAGLVDLCRLLLAVDRRVVAYHHEAPWVDVNDADAVARATQLLKAHPELEQWWANPPVRKCAAAVRDGQLLVSDQSRSWALPLAAAPVVTIDVLDGARPLRLRVGRADIVEPWLGWHWAQPRDSLEARVVLGLG